MLRSLDWTNASAMLPPPARTPAGGDVSYEMFMPGTFGMHDAEQRRLYERRKAEQSLRQKAQKIERSEKAGGAPMSKAVARATTMSRTVDVDATSKQAPQQRDESAVYHNGSQRPVHQMRLPLAMHKQTPRASPVRTRPAISDKKNVRTLQDAPRTPDVTQH